MNTSQREMQHDLEVAEGATQTKLDQKFTHKKMGGYYIHGWWWPDLCQTILFGIMIYKFKN